MYVWAGKLLIFGGCAALGFLRGEEWRKRADCLADFRRVLAFLLREISFSLCPLGELMEKVQGRGPAAPFFAACREEFQESWADSWKLALEQTTLPLRRSDRLLLEETGDILGRYDGESQRQALEGLLRRLEEHLTEARREGNRRFRVCLVLGISAGLFLCILL